MNNSEHFQLDWGTHAILKLLADYAFESVLDIGSGLGEHKRLFEYFGKKPVSVDIVQSADYCGNFLDIDIEKKFDAIWCSHALEHQRNVGLFLDKIYDSLTEDGVLAIVVPIHPGERLISGHLTSWSIPLLCYNLIMAGFDCRQAAIMSSYELSLVVKKTPANHNERRAPSAHGADAGHEFDNIKQFFPFEVSQGVTLSVEGLGLLNWKNPVEYHFKLPQEKIGFISIDSKNFKNSPTLKPNLISHFD